MSNNIKPSKYPVGPDEEAELFDQAVAAGRAGKQDTLVSGTNIKTINGASVLGTGDLTVSGSGASWGSITGTLSSQTDLNTALSGKEPTITAGTTAQYYRGDKTFQTLDKSAVGLSNVDNTSDANKPISTSTQTALNTKQDTLVSGTNIKTINGVSILGSGDIISDPITIGSAYGTGVTGLNNSVSATVLIPANTINVTNTIYIKAFIDRTLVSGTGSTTFRFYINTTNSLTGATLLGSAGSMGTTVRFQRFERNIYVDITNMNCFATGTSASNDYTISAISLIPFNKTVDNYLIFTVQHSASATDIAAWKRVTVQKYA